MYGECNVPESNTGFVAIAAGWYYSLGLKQDGSIVAWGRNDSGECNVPSPNTGFIAIAAGVLVNRLGLNKMARLWHGDGKPTVHAMSRSPIRVLRVLPLAGHYSLGLKADGSVLAWGM